MNTLIHTLASASLSLLLASAADAAPKEAAPQAETLTRLRVLVTNDDGIASEGITAMVKALRPFADVVVAAPMRNFSGAGGSVTFISGELRVKPQERAPGVPGYAVDGTPADSAVFGVRELGREKSFDLVISGINLGENVGDAVFASGTVGAARQAAILGVPAIAVSQAHVRDGKYDFTVAAAYTARLAQRLHEMGPARPVLVSVNVPADPKGVKLAATGGAAFTIGGFKRLPDGPQGIQRYGVALAQGGAAPAGSDAAALRDGYIAVTVLSLDPDAPAKSLPADLLTLPPAN